MVTDVWSDQDLPLLEQIAEHEIEHGPLPDIHRVVQLKLDDAEEKRLNRSLGRLHDHGMINATTIKGWGGLVLYKHISLTTEGRRAVGQWPSRDVAAALMQALNAKVDQASTPEERKGWERIRDDVKALGISAVASLLVEAGKQAGGL